MLGHDPVVQQPVVVQRALDHLHQQVVGGGAGGVRLALGLPAVLEAGQQEEQVVRVAQELLALARELERRLVLEHAGGQPQEPRQAVVLDSAVLLVQDLTTAAGRTERCSFIYLFIYLSNRNTFTCWSLPR